MAAVLVKSPAVLFWVQPRSAQNADEEENPFRLFAFLLVKKTY